MSIETYSQVINAPYLNINGMQISTDATSPNTVIDIAAGLARSQDDVWDINLGNYGGVFSGQTPNTVTYLTSTTVGLNGIDTGTIAANKLYRVYVVADFFTSQPTGVLISLADSTVGPLMPFGYNAFRLIGYVATNGSADFLVAYIGGNDNPRTLMYDTPQATAVTAGHATSYTGVVLTALVPDIDNTPAWLATSYIPATAGNTLSLQPYGATGAAATITGQVATVPVTTNSLVMSKVNTGVPTVNYKLTSGSDAVAIDVAGFQFYI